MISAKIRVVLPQHYEHYLVFEFPYSSAWIFSMQVIVLATQALCDERRQYFASYNGQFVVSRARVLSQPIELYRELRRNLLVRLSWSILVMR